MIALFFYCDILLQEKLGGACMRKIGFIGMGNMGFAMLKGALREFAAEDIVFYDANIDRMNYVSKETEVKHLESNADLVRTVKYIVLAVKPQFFNIVLEDIADEVTEEHVIISIAPGITIEQLKEKLGFDARIVRAMPNTPALVGEGMTGVTYNQDEFNFEEKQNIEKIFKAIGKMKIVSENLMSAVTCASGSSPAYVFMFIEALADGAVRCGMSRSDAYEFAAQTVYGSAKMVMETKAHPGILKDMVCSPAGTTIDAVKVLEDNGFRSAIMKATEACFDKCESFKK